MSAGDALIHARGLVKTFGTLRAVDGIDFDVARGEAFGFLGPNGAGKSSTMRMIGCVSPVTDGTLRVLGLDPARDGPAIRGRLGVVPQLDTLDNELTVRENVIIYGRYFGLSRSEVRERADRLLEFVQLTERSGDPVEPLSGGMKRRLTIARSLVNEPELMLLDEPTTGLDPQARHAVWDRFFRLKRQGVTLVLTTHYMDEAEQLCDRLVIMDRGKIAEEGSPQELIRRLSTRDVVELRFPGDAPEVGPGTFDGLAARIETLPRVDKDSGFAALFRFGIVPLFLFSGTFFPVTRLPVGLRQLAYATPLWQGVDLCRHLTLGTVTLGTSLPRIAYLLVLAAAGFALALRTYTWRLVR